MLEIRGIKNVKKIMWYEIVPGMILLGGVKINDQVPPELQGFPVLTPELLRAIQDKYHLLKTHEIVVAQCLPGVNSRQLSLQIKQRSEEVNKINIFRKEFARDKRELCAHLGLDINNAFIKSRAVESDYLVLDRSNSFTVPHKQIAAGTPLPSFLNHIDLTLTTGDLLTNRINAKLNLPLDEEVLLHLVIDYSQSMQADEKLKSVTTALNFFAGYIPTFLSHTKLRCYAFSRECRPLNFPLSGREMKGEEANYASFIKKVLHFKNKEIRNKVLLFTTGQPADPEAAFQLARLFPKNRLDFTQIIIIPALHAGQFVSNTHQQHTQPDFRDFTSFADACTGNQVILKSCAPLKIVTVECYDHYLGLLSLAKAPVLPPTNRETGQAPVAKGKEQGQASPPKKVMQWKEWYQQKQKQ